MEVNLTLKNEMMPMTPSPLNAEHLRGAALSTIIIASFAALWGLNGSIAIPGRTRIVLIMLVLLVTALLFRLAFVFTRAARHLPTTDTPTANPFGSRVFRFVNIAQVVAIVLVSRLLTAIGYPDATISAVAIIVGLHFFGLVGVFQSWRFAAVGGAMILLGLGSLFLTPSIVIASGGEALALRTAAVGLGCAVILWAGIFPLVIATRRQIHFAANGA